MEFSFVPYRCPRCGEGDQFATISQLKSHFQIAHSKVYSSPQRKRMQMFSFDGGGNNNDLLSSLREESLNLEERLRLAKENEIKNKLSFNSSLSIGADYTYSSSNNIYFKDVIAALNRDVVESRKDLWDTANDLYQSHDIIQDIEVAAENHCQKQREIIVNLNNALKAKESDIKKANSEIEKLNKAKEILTGECKHILERATKEGQKLKEELICKEDELESVSEELDSFKYKAEKIVHHKDKEIEFGAEKIGILQKQQKKLVLESRNILKKADVDRTILKKELDLREEKIYAINNDLEDIQQQQKEILRESFDLLKNAQNENVELKDTLKLKEMKLKSLKGELKKVKDSKADEKHSEDDIKLSTQPLLLHENPSKTDEVANEELEKLKAEQSILTEESEYLKKKVLESEKALKKLDMMMTDRDAKLSEKDRELNSLKEFLNTTAEKELKAKEKLEKFITNLIDRAEKAEKELTTLRRYGFNEMQMDGTAERMADDQPSSILKKQNAVNEDIHEESESLMSNEKSDKRFSSSPQNKSAAGVSDDNIQNQPSSSNKPHGGLPESSNIGKYFHQQENVLSNRDVDDESEYNSAIDNSMSTNSTSTPKHSPFRQKNTSLNETERDMIEPDTILRSFTDMPNRPARKQKDEFMDEETTSVNSSPARKQKNVFIDDRSTTNAHLENSPSANEKSVNATSRPQASIPGYHSNIQHHHFQPAQFEHNQQPYPSPYNINDRNSYVPENIQFRNNSLPLQRTQFLGNYIHPSNHTPRKTRKFSGGKMQQNLHRGWVSSQNTHPENHLLTTPQYHPHNASLQHLNYLKSTSLPNIPSQIAPSPYTNQQRNAYMSQCNLDDDYCMSQNAPLHSNAWQNAPHSAPFLQPNFHHSTTDPISYMFACTPQNPPIHRNEGSHQHSTHSVHSLKNSEVAPEEGNKGHLKQKAQKAIHPKIFHRQTSASTIDESDEFLITPLDVHYEEDKFNSGDSDNENDLYEPLEMDELGIMWDDADDAYITGDTLGFTESGAELNSTEIFNSDSDNESEQDFLQFSQADEDGEDSEDVKTGSPKYGPGSGLHKEQNKYSLENSLDDMGVLICSDNEDELSDNVFDFKNEHSKFNSDSRPESQGLSKKQEKKVTFSPSKMPSSFIKENGSAIQISDLELSDSKSPLLKTMEEIVQKSEREKRNTDKQLMLSDKKDTTKLHNKSRSLDNLDEQGVSPHKYKRQHHIPNQSTNKYFDDTSHSKMLKDRPKSESFEHLLLNWSQNAPRTNESNTKSLHIDSSESQTISSPNKSQTNSEHSLGTNRLKHYLNSVDSEKQQVNIPDKHKFDTQFENSQRHQGYVRPVSPVKKLSREPQNSNLQKVYDNLIKYSAGKGVDEPQKFSESEISYKLKDSKDLFHAAKYNEDKGMDSNDFKGQGLDGLPSIDKQDMYSRQAGLTMSVHNPSLVDRNNDSQDLINTKIKEPMQTGAIFIHDMNADTTVLPGNVDKLAESTGVDRIDQCSEPHGAFRSNSSKNHSTSSKPIPVPRANKKENNGVFNNLKTSSLSDVQSNRNSSSLEIKEAVLHKMPFEYDVTSKNALNNPSHNKFNEGKHSEKGREMSKKVSFTPEHVSLENCSQDNARTSNDAKAEVFKTLLKNTDGDLYVRKDSSDPKASLDLSDLGLKSNNSYSSKTTDLQAEAIDSEHSSDNKTSGFEEDSHTLDEDPMYPSTNFNESRTTEKHQDTNRDQSSNFKAVDIKNGAKENLLSNSDIRNSSRSSAVDIMQKDLSDMTAIDASLHSEDYDKSSDNVQNQQSDVKLTKTNIEPQVPPTKDDKNQNSIDFDGRQNITLKSQKSVVNSNFRGHIPFNDSFSSHDDGLDSLCQTEHTDSDLDRLAETYARDTPLGQNVMPVSQSTVKKPLKSSKGKKKRLTKAMPKGAKDKSNENPMVEKLVMSQKREEARKRRQVMFCVFMYLDTKTLCGVSMVCKEWKKVSRHPALWTKVYLKHSQISSQFLTIISSWCTETQHLTLQGLKPRNRRDNERNEEYMKSTRGILQGGLEQLLMKCQNTLITFRVIDCGNTLTDRCLSLAGCYCRFLRNITFISSTDPVGPEVLWTLGGGCFDVKNLIIPPLYPCQNNGIFTNKCLQMISQFFRDLEVLSVGGREITEVGLVQIAKGCPRLIEMELDHMVEITDDTASAICDAGFNNMRCLKFIYTPVTVNAIRIFHENCRPLQSVIIHSSINDYFSDVSKNNIKKYEEKINDLKELRRTPGFWGIMKITADPISQMN